MATSESGSRSGLVLELAEEFLDRYRAGQRPALKEYVDRHPDLAAEIREVFPAMAMMEHIALADETIDSDQNGAVTVPRLEQLGNYRVIREVGRGGMGVVYEAEQVSLGRHVALKVLPPQSLRDVKQRRRFEREARAAAKLHHTNIVPVFGVGEQEETPYYVMQFIQGQGLDAVLEELKRLRAAPKSYPREADADGESTARHTPVRRDAPAADVARSLLTGRFEPAGDLTEPPNEKPRDVHGNETGSDALSSSALSLPGGPPRGKSKRQTYWEGVARIGHQVADALAYAHGQGIVHRDIKPSNLLLDTKGTVWVADFGLAKAQDQQNLTNTGDILGTLRYMPPEAFGGKADARGDIYSLGLTLYEMLAFRPAFDERDRGQLVKQVTTEEPPRLKKLNPEVPRDLETIVQKAIEHDPAHRYASASELADDLRRFVDDEPIHARRASIAERLTRWGRRNPVVTSLAAAVALLLSAVIGGLWYNVEASKHALIVQTRLRAEAELEKRNAELAAVRESDQKAIAIAAKQKAESANKALVASQDSLRSTLYAAQMNLTKVAWDSVTPARTLDLLAASTPKPGEPDLRGFEWHYWRRTAHAEHAVRKLPGFGQPGFRSRVFSPDGSLAACVDASSGHGRSRKLLVYDTATGRLLHKLPFKVRNTSENFLLRGAIAFSDDGKMVALHIGYPVHSGGSVSTNRDWQVQTIVWTLGDELELFHDSEVIKVSGVILNLSMNANGSRIAIGWYALDRSKPNSRGMMGSLRVLDVKGGPEYLNLKFTDEGSYGTDFSTDGRSVATASFIPTGPNPVVFSSRIMIYEVETGRVRFDSGIQKTVRTNWVQFSPDGHLLAASTSGLSFDSGLSIIDVDRGQQVARESVTGLESFPRLNFNPDGRTLVLTSASGPSAQVRDAGTGRLVQSLSLGVRGSDDVVIRRSDRRLLTIHGDDLREWNLTPDRPASLDAGLVLEKVGGPAAVLNREIALADGGRQVLVLQASDDPSKPGELAVHDVTTGKVILHFPSQMPDSAPDPNSHVNWMKSNSAGTTLAAVIGDLSSFDQSTTRFRIWDLTSGHQLLTLDRDHIGGVPSNLSCAVAWM
jgi:serine/threonine protein kinase/WD40 repeat protein